jgi:high-affinity iron transporter
VLANFFIGLREGVEASLIIGILVAFLVKQNRQKDLKPLWAGVVSAIALSVFLGLLLGFIADEEPANVEPIISGVASLLAATFVTWMIFWMARQSKALNGQLSGKLASTESSGALSVFAIAFLAVIREGVETSVFIWSASKSTGPQTAPIAGAILGLLTAAVIGYLLYRGTLKFNLRTFFKYTGAFLILVTAGIFAYGFSELQEVGVLPFLTSTAYDVSAWVPESGALDIILRGMLSFNSKPSVLVVLAWFAYLIPTAAFFIRGYSAKKPATK